MSPRYQVNISAAGYSYFYVQAETAEDARVKADEMMDFQPTWDSDFVAVDVTIDSIEEDS
jgi:hypothetical protein